MEEEDFDIVISKASNLLKIEEKIEFNSKADLVSSFYLQTE